MIRYEIDEAVNGFRVTIWDNQSLAYKENTETKLQAYGVLLEFLTKDIAKEQIALQQATSQIH